MKSFKHKNTCFALFYSSANSAYVFSRTDSGFNTETAIIQDNAEALKTFREKVDFFKSIMGVK